MTTHEQNKWCIHFAVCCLSRHAQVTSTYRPSELQDRRLNWGTDWDTVSIRVTDVSEKPTFSIFRTYVQIRDTRRSHSWNLEMRRPRHPKRGCWDIEKKRSHSQGGQTKFLPLWTPQFSLLLRLLHKTCFKHAWKVFTILVWTVRRMSSCFCFHLIYETQSYDLVEGIV